MKQKTASKLKPSLP